MFHADSQEIITIHNDSLCDPWKSQVFTHDSQMIHGAFTDIHAMITRNHLTFTSIHEILEKSNKAITFTFTFLFSFLFSFSLLNLKNFDFHALFTSLEPDRMHGLALVARHRHYVLGSSSRRVGDVQLREAIPVA